LKLILLILFFININYLFGQVENVPISNPVYDFLLRAENKGYMQNMSLSALPLTKKEVIKVLINLKENENKLSYNDKETLYRYLTEFEVFDYNIKSGNYYNNNSKDFSKNSEGHNLLPLERIVLFYNDIDTNQLFSSNLFNNTEKYLYHYQDSNNKVILRPLGKVDYNFQHSNMSGNRNALMAYGGFRLNGTIDRKLGYLLQATNGSLLNGDRQLALQDPLLRQNIKFNNLNSDVDITESHLRYEQDWFYAYIGRETRQLGAGIDQKLFISNTSPTADGIQLGAKFSNFEYRFSHYSLLALRGDSSQVGTGFQFTIPSKYYVMHRFSFRPKWGEISFWEGVIYSERSMEIGYLNPLSFLKSMEHALRDRDNSTMGIDFTLRPMDNLQIKGSFLLDDVIISEIGKGFWSNKTAWNIGTTYSFNSPIDIAFEYTRVEPYTFSHFNKQNSITNDGLLFGSNIQPNSDRILFRTNVWIGQRYPLFCDLSLTRHGKNIFDSNNDLIKNVGGDPLIVQNSFLGDSDRVTFLDGNLSKILRVDIGGAIEPVRHFNIHLRVYYENSMNFESYNNYGARVTFRFEDF